MNENEVVIEKQKIIRMVNRIYELERENTKTGKRNEKEMKAEIERIIEEEAKMLLKSISYKDFRPFKGNQYIDLTPKDDNKDATVTVIIGNNTYGKSTFVLSFIWCLYGESRFNRPNDILNKKSGKELDVNEKATASVEVVFEDGGKEYTMKRVQEFKNRKRIKGI